MEEWEVEFTDEFRTWWDGLTEAEQIDVRAEVNLLRRFGPTLGRPHVDSVASSKHANMKELRIQHRGRPYRVLFAFDPRRTANSADRRKQNREGPLVQGVCADSR